MKPPTQPWMDYEEIRQRANTFLDQYWHPHRLPIDVEKIADVRLGIDIITVRGLQSKAGVEGYLSRDRRSIYVDGRVRTDVPARYRFTVAHELGHLELHGALYDYATFRSPLEWIDFQSSLSQTDRIRYEWQANCFAGLILVPKDPLADAVHEAVLHARRHGHEVDLRDGADRDYVASWVGRKLRVSAEVISKRGGFDGLWHND